MFVMLRNLILFVTLWLTLVTTTFADANKNKNFADRPNVQAFINTMVKKHHFNKQALTSLFNTVKIRPQIMRHINKPLEKSTWNTYQMLFVNEWRIEHGVKFWNKYKDALARAEKIYGVPANIIVATIGVETKYGERVGEYRVIDSLSNIAFGDSTRAKFFQSELTEFLLLTREQHLDPLKVMGSYAGAIGQPQFMPSSYRYYAVNFSGSGKIDLTNDEVDVIGSIANYYKKHGWITNAPVAIPAAVIGHRYEYFLNNKSKLSKSYTINELARYGVIPKHQIKAGDLMASVIELQNRYSNEYWLGFRNFYVIKRYNPSDLYAMAVYQLSNYISQLKGRMNNG
jgi:membrane-bound lytic murein transglycosylase B